MEIKDYTVFFIWDFSCFGFKVGWYPRKTLPIFWYIILGWFEIRIFPPMQCVIRVGRQYGEIEG